MFEMPTIEGLAGAITQRMMEGESADEMARMMEEVMLLSEDES